MISREQKLKDLARSFGAAYDPKTETFSILDLEGGVDYEAVLLCLIEQAKKIN